MFNKRGSHSLKHSGSEDRGEVEGRHAVVLVVTLHQGEEVAEVAEEAEVNIWEPLEEVSEICPGTIITTPYRQNM